MMIDVVIRFCFQLPERGEASRRQDGIPHMMVKIDDSRFKINNGPKIPWTGESERR
jgi:hypothetical protein